jgi:hypothetical protein
MTPPLALFAVGRALIAFWIAVVESALPVLSAPNWVTTFSQSTLRSWVRAPALATW